MSARKSLFSKASKQQSADPGFNGSNPFDSYYEPDPNSRPARASSAPPMNKMNPKIPQFIYDDDEEESNETITPPFSYMGYSAAKNRYKNGFHDSGGFENQPVQELEQYAAYKAEETTDKVNGCLKIAEEIREDATRTLVSLHQQGEQITRTHLVAANIEPDLSRGEKLLGSLGGMFSRTWKPKKTHRIKGPTLTRDDSFIKRSSHAEQRHNLGISNPRSRSNPPRQFPHEPTSALDKVEVEKAKQEDALTDLSIVVSQLKEMAIDMGSEISWQNKALDGFQDDADEIIYRVRGANQRVNHLLRK